jgi:hypothetical protein
MRTPLIVILVLAGLAVAGFALLGIGLRNAGNAVEFLAAADDPYLYDLDGNQVDLIELVQSGVTVFIYTRSDCPLSNRYAPDVRKLHETFHPRGVNFYLIYVDPAESTESIHAHFIEYDYPCRALRDPDHTTLRVTEATVTPEAVVFAAGGRITYRGRIDDLYPSLGTARPAPTTHDLRDAIEATLAGRGVAEPVTKAVGCYIGDLK